MFKFFLQRCPEKGDKDIEVNKQQIPNGKHCNQALKKFQLFQENGCLQKDAQLLSLYSRLFTKKEYADMELALIIEQGSVMGKQTTQAGKVYEVKLSTVTQKY